MAERGREPIIATGRGGAGNMVRSPSRGRPQTESLPPPAAIKAAHNPAVGNLVHSGRGGAGNVRSPSRDPTERQRVLEAEKAEHKLQADYAKTEASHYTATGRGGAGNIQPAGVGEERGRGESQDRSSSAGAGGAVGNILRSLSRSRSRSREPRPTDRRRPSTETLDSPNERSLSRSRAAAGQGSTAENSGGSRGLPAVSENGGSVGVIGEGEEEGTSSSATGAGTGTTGGGTSIKDKILGHLGGGSKAT
ncbi:hypothetical protein A4X13_0g2857 [Tilletia indica]|uniref:Uncharacterized protein n=1 Tax=Tilletia indica TaxID=43049 RepID=A0A177TFK4_9BASI|nr:hypothetical protein A4X13_0g2857 [Tilletia indica]